jgi:hypothetical protein
MPHFEPLWPMLLSLTPPKGAISVEIIALAESRWMRYSNASPARRMRPD